MVEMRSIDDVDTQKKWIDQYIVEAFTDKEYKGKKVTLKVTNPVIVPRDYSLEEQKKALLSRRNLSRPIKGDLTLIDNETGKVLDRKKQFTIANAPYHTGRNTIISNGSYYAPINQVRLRPGAYTRKKASGEIETHFNLISGTGSGMRVNLEPETGVFGMQLGTSNIKLYPLLKAMKIDDEKLQSIWGKDILEINKARSGGDKDILKMYEKLVPYGDPNVTPEQKIQAIVVALNRAKMDPEINKITLGSPYSNVTGDAILDATKKIVSVSKGIEKEDDRDSLQFKSIHSIEDFYKEKIQKDAGDIGRMLVVRKLDRSPSLENVPQAYFTRQLWGTVKSDPVVSPTGTLAQPIEEINPLDVYDQHHKITTMGEGGIGDMHVVSLEARNVHPSQFGFVDHVRTPESVNVGIDQRLALGVRKGADNKIYRQFVNAKTGKKEWLHPLQTMRSVVAFPNEMTSKKKEVDAMDHGRVVTVPAKNVEYYLEYPNDMYSTYDNLIPMAQSIQGNRMILAGKALGQTLPLVHGEAPLVRSLNPRTGNSYEYDLGSKVMAKTSKVSGTVTAVTPNDIYVNKVRHGLFNNFPLNLKTVLTHRPKVKKGDTVKEGDLIATSNYTDDEGVTSHGVNLHSAYAPYKGWNYEDGIVLSEDAAQKLTSEQLYTYEYKIDDPEGQTQNRDKFATLFPTLYAKMQLDKLEKSGVVKPGDVIKPGDPIIVAAEKRPVSSKDIQLGNLHKSLKNRFSDKSIAWDHHTDGVVTDVYQTDNYTKVLIKTRTPAKVGDKLTGRYGNKGVISNILPNESMPYDKETGEKIEILLNPVSIPSRINPAQMHEVVLGKIAKKVGEPYILQSFGNDDMVKFVKDEMKKHGVKDTTTLVIPDDNKELKGVLTGRSYIWKLSKLSEGEMKKRELAGYDINEQPIKGKTEAGQAMRVGNMEINAFLGHGSTHNMREISTIKGQKNPEFWTQLKLGNTLPTPRVPFVYEKFMTMLEGAGINVKKDGPIRKLIPLTDRDILKRSNGEITKPETLYAKNLMPVKEGLFDPGLTGGTVGNNWTHIKLTEALPNPIMEEPIKKILRVNKSQLDKIIKEGTIMSELKKLNLDTEIELAQAEMKGSSENTRNEAIKRLSYLQTLKDNGLAITDLALHNVPVIPPVFRPVSVVGTRESVSVGDANLLYKDLMLTNSLLADQKKELPSEALSSERDLNYKALKSVVGLGDPVNVKNLNRRVKGFVASIVGDQPKTGFFQRKVFSKTQDLVGRAVATPDPSLSMDQLGVPEDIAWKMFDPFIVRNMVKDGVSPVDAKKEIELRSPRALKYLKTEMEYRPVIMNRNPTLHKYNVMAFQPVLSNSDTVKAAPVITPGFNLDHDGDQVNLHVPVTPEAVREAKEMLMPSKNLLAVKDRKVHYTPLQESVLAMYSMTLPPEKRELKNKFATVKEMKEALAKNEVDLKDMVEVG